MAERWYCCLRPQATLPSARRARLAHLHMPPTEINSIADAINLVQSLRSTPFVTDGAWPLDNFPFGFWFRGHLTPGQSPEPRVFRPNNEARPGQEGTWDETNVVEHLKLRLPSYERTYHSAFDWLCLMQHYSVPTRLLDWSESLLPALYFAVKDEATNPGELIVLNARRLNEQVKGRPAISSINDGGVIVRSEMAAARSAGRFCRQREVRSALLAEGISLDDDAWLDWFSAPIAVFPSRLNDRMVFQSSVFTLHGGKQYVEKIKPLYVGDTIPAPVRLERVNGNCSPDAPVLKRYQVNNKKKILGDLFLLGIHEGTLFPEVDRQAVYLEKLWWYPNAN